MLLFWGRSFTPHFICLFGNLQEPDRIPGRRWLCNGIWLTVGMTRTHRVKRKKNHKTASAEAVCLQRTEPTGPEGRPVPARPCRVNRQICVLVPVPLARGWLHCGDWEPGGSERCSGSHRPGGRGCDGVIPQPGEPVVFI